MKWVRFSLSIAVVLILCACTTPTLNPASPGTTLILPGIFGDTPDYNGLAQGLAAGGNQDRIQLFHWGDGLPLFLVNLSSQNLHEASEKQLADYLTNLHKKDPASQIALIGHSGGAGVILGTLPRLNFAIGPVILLAPAVSPDYNLKPALEHCSLIHVFYSPDDDFWQGLGPQLCGNYDNAHRSGAGRYGFTLAGLDESEKARVLQHPYSKDWQKFGVYGGHFEWLRGAFAAEVLEPLISENQ
jgi:hypothetical protein